MKTGWVLMVAVLSAGALMLAGCGKAKEKAAAKAMELSLRHAGAKDASVDISGQNMTIKTKDGEVVISGGDSASIPADFPKDVFVEKSAKIRLAMKNPEGFVINLETGVAVPKAAETYDAGMKAQGWVLDASMDMGETRSLTYKKDTRQTTIIVSKSGKATAVMIAVNEKKS